MNVKDFVFEEDATYVITNDDNVYLGKYYGEATSYQIIESIFGYTVIGIGSYAFCDCTSITEITIPNGIRVISDYAFDNLRSLESIMVPQSVTSIGTGAFQKCNKLTIGFEGEFLPENLGSFWNGRAGYFTDVKDFVIQEDATYVITNNNEVYLGKYYGYADSYSIDETIHGHKVIGVGAYAFYQNTAIKSVTISKNIVTIGDEAFYNCFSLENITISENLKTIGNSAFAYCTALKSITIPENTISIGMYAFYNCTALENIKFNAVYMADLSKDNYVFYCAGKNANGIRVVIGKNVEKIPNFIFNPFTNPYTASESSKFSPNIYYVEFEEESNCEIIGNYSFAHSAYITSIDLPENLKTIGNYAFSYCSSLENITIPKKLETIGSSAFRSCTSLKSINIPDSVNEIGASAFINA